MKKLLSLALAMLFSWSMFAQDAILYDFENDANGWTVAEANDVYEAPYNNWIIDDAFANGNNWYVSYCPVGMEVQNLLFSPEYSLTAADAAGSFSFGMYCAIAGGETDVTTTVRILVAINGTYYTESDLTLKSTDGYTIHNIPFSSFAGLLTNPTNTVQFIIAHMATENNNDEAGEAALLIDDAILRKRADAYVIQFFPENEGVTGTMNYIVTEAGGHFTMPAATFTAPSPLAFISWDEFDGNNNLLGSYTVGAPMTVSEDKYYYAYYMDASELVQFTVQYMANGGTGYMAPMTSYHGQPHIAMECAFTAPAGKVFKEWNENADGTGASVMPGDGIDIDDNDDGSQPLVLYAIWQDAGQGGGDEPQPGDADVYTVTFDANGGQGTMAAVEFPVDGDNWYTLPACQFTRQGYTFIGWATDPNGNNMLSGEININRNMTFYAIWQYTGGGESPDPLAISDINNAQISIYPNPAQNMIRVNGINAERLDLMDLTGRVVLSNEGVNTMDLSTVANGVYMLRISASEGIAVRKVVKK